ncbi:hypothetical protein [Streptomyces albidochromogenes]|uniref:Uncharacterized protein n=1 Tax=Streptomyces albidochromogenes TaxID=329524 RepID=A0ABW6FFZ8_9ACTN
MRQQQSPIGGYQDSAACLARRVLGCLRGVESPPVLAAHVGEAPEPAVALAAVRILGPDALAPALLGGGPLHPDDAEVVEQALAASVSPADVSGAPGTGAWLLAWHDWALARGADRLPAAGAVVMPRVPQDQEDAGWGRWSGLMGQLAALALPGLTSAVHEAARDVPLVLSRGAVRAVLRQDYATAARITRWLAWLHTCGVDVPLDLKPLVDHVGLMGVGDRLALDTAIARLLIAP